MCAVEMIHYLLSFCFVSMNLNGSGHYLFHLQMIDKLLINNCIFMKLLFVAQINCQT